MQRRIPMMVLLAAVLSAAPMFAQSSQLMGSPANGMYTASNMLTGTVQSTNRGLNYLTVRNDATGQDVKIDVRQMNTRRSINVWNLRAGDRVSVNGAWENRDTFQADSVGSFTGQPMSGTSVNSANMLNGVVQRVNRNLNFVVVRDQATGRRVKVDTRRMNVGRSAKVSQLRPGDVIVADGGWENNNTFQANTVNLANSQQPMTSAYGTENVLRGAVQGLNRDLSYVTVRDDATGQLVKIDVRQMSTRQSVNVWKLRPGDRIVVSGGWENRDTFRASTVNF